MELVIGTILSTGQTLDDVLDMSWEHIRFSSKAIMAHKSFMLEIVFDAVSAGLGGKKTKNKNSNKRGRVRAKESKESKKQKEANLLNKLNSMGFNV